MKDIAGQFKKKSLKIQENTVWVTVHTPIKKQVT